MTPDNVRYGVCPTPCDPACTGPCHERHLPPFKRSHSPAECPSRQPI